MQDIACGWFVRAQLLAQRQTLYDGHTMHLSLLVYA